MNSSSRLDQIIAQLRRQPKPSYRASGPQSPVDGQQVRSPEQAAPQTPASSALAAVRALKDSGVSDEKFLVRRYIEEVLKHELSERALNDSEFQHSLVKLLSMLEDDDEAWTTCLDRIRQ